MKVSELRKALDDVNGEMRIFIDLFSKEVELNFKDLAVINEGKLVIAPDEGAFLSSPFKGDQGNE